MASASAAAEANKALFLEKVIKGLDIDDDDVSDDDDAYHRASSWR